MSKIMELLKKVNTPIMEPTENATIKIKMQSLKIQIVLKLQLKMKKHFLVLLPNNPSQLPFKPTKSDSKPTKEESSQVFVGTNLTMVSLQLDMEHQMAKATSKLKTHGEEHGEIKDISSSKEKEMETANAVSI